MRRYCIILISVLTLAPLFAKAQQVPVDSLLFYEHNYFSATDETEKTNILLQKIRLYKNYGQTGTELYREIKRVRYELMEAGAPRSNFLWNAAVVAYLNQEDAGAVSFFRAYTSATTDSSTGAAFLYFLIHKSSDTLLLHQQIKNLCLKDPAFSSLYCMKELITVQPDRKNRYMLASALLPGAGSVAAGYPVRGFVSAALVGASAFGVYSLVSSGLYLNAALWGSGVGLKFYTGNVRLSGKLYERKRSLKKNKLADDCELELKKLLDKYPLILRE